MRSELKELEEKLTEYEQQINEVDNTQDLDTPAQDNDQDAMEVCTIEDYTPEFEDLDGSDEVREEYTLANSMRDHDEEDEPADAPQSNLQRGLNNMKAIQERLIEQNNLLRQNMERLSRRNIDLEQLLEEVMIDRRAQWLEEEASAMKNEDGEMILPNGGTVCPNQARDDHQMIEHLREHIGKLSSDNTRLVIQMRQCKEASEEAESKVEVLTQQLAARESCLQKCDGSGLPLENICQHSDRLSSVLQDMEALKKQVQEELAVLRAQNAELLESEAKAINDAVESNVKVQEFEAQISALAEHNEWLENERGFMLDTLTQRTHGLDAVDLDQHFENKYKDALDRADQVIEGYQIKLHDQAGVIQMRGFELENTEIEIHHCRLITEGLEISNAVLKARVDAFESRYAMELLQQPLPIDLRDQVEKLSEEQMMVARNINTMYYSLVSMEATPGTVPDWMQ